MRLTKTYDVASFKATPEAGEGTFEAIVSVIGNVDLQGDRVMPHAFDKSIEKWTKSGTVVPVVWSHEWADPFAHIGYINPSDMREIAPGKSSAMKGGLLVKGHLDVDKPFAKQVYDLLAARRVKEFSFAYDIPPGGEKRGKDGANELHELDIIEVGPTLKGANSETALLGVKSRLDRAAKLEHAGSAPIQRSRKPKSAKDASSLIAWFNDGADGKIDWGSEGDWEQCVSVASEHMSEDDAKGFCQLRHMDATGMTTSEHAHMEGKSVKSGRVIGQKASAALKERILSAIDEFVADINGGAEETTETKTVDDAVIELNKKLDELAS